MKKTDKKRENALREALTKVCDQMLGEVAGFVWLTHLVDFNRFPQSVKIVCVFERDENLEKALAEGQDARFYQAIDEQFKLANVGIKNSRPYVSFDTEEACERCQQGNWNQRFKRLSLH
ncbi:Fis family transcriptional regulator [Marinomonas pollencensis]|uniref:Fis family transcriptional regulator n=1 Tax=Marinomonas pollencensis TaxID=491954 RepID=A0A3E0DNS0_9GAMM|nr:Fis family transcriptional regulator [Marinomonas pollencensis]REG84363.1 hypothetical protein DFP81_104243 [Marinomonas pollencensis]